MMNFKIFYILDLGDSDLENKGSESQRDAKITAVNLLDVEVDREENTILSTSVWKAKGVAMVPG